MTYNLKMTSNISDLLEMTGLEQKDLALHGFFLDDVDVIIQSDKPLNYLQTYHDDDGTEYQAPEPYEDATWLIEQMEQMCAYECVIYCDKYYYLVYHA